MNKMLKKTYIILISIIALLSFLPVFAAETYELTVPFSEETKTVANPADYLFALYRFSLIAGGALALVVIAYHAIRYITSAGNPSKQGDAKDGIVKAIIGLSLLLGAVVLLNTIGVTPEALQLETVTVKTAVADPVGLFKKKGYSDANIVEIAEQLMRSDIEALESEDNLKIQEAKLDVLENQKIVNTNPKYGLAQNNLTKAKIALNKLLIEEQVGLIAWQETSLPKYKNSPGLQANMQIELEKNKKIKVYLENINSMLEKDLSQESNP